MTPKKTTEPRDDDGLGVLDESASLDTTGIGILPGTAQVSVVLPQDHDDDLIDDDVIADEEVFAELILDERVVVDPVRVGEIGRINDETADIIIELPAELPRENELNAEAPNAHVAGPNETEREVPGPETESQQVESADATDVADDAEASASTVEQPAPVAALVSKLKKKARVKPAKAKKAVAVDAAAATVAETAEPRSSAADDAESTEPQVDLDLVDLQAPTSHPEIDPELASDPAATIVPDDELADGDREESPDAAVEPATVDEGSRTAPSEVADESAASGEGEGDDFEPATEPEFAEPELEEPQAFDPEVVKPEAVEPEVAEPEFVDAEVVEPEVAEPEAVEPEFVEPEAVDPEVVEPEVVEPEVVEPEAVEPASGKPELEQRDSAEPELAQPEPAEAAMELDQPQVVQPEQPEQSEAHDDYEASADVASEATDAKTDTPLAALGLPEPDYEAEEHARIESIEALLAVADAAQDDEPAAHEEAEVSELAPVLGEATDDARQGSADSAPAIKETESIVTAKDENPQPREARNVPDAPRAARPELTSKRLGELSEPSRESADLLTADRLLDPHQVTKPEPEGAWAHFLYTVSGRRINIGDGKRARARKELSARIAAPLLGGARFVPVLSRKGGVGKTTITTLLGMALADAREDRVIAVDANPDRGTLADRIPRTNGKSVRDLVRVHEEIRGYHDVSAIVARDATRLDVLASDADPRVAEAFSDDDYRDVAEVAARYYSLVLTDTGTGIVHSVMGATLDLSDQIIIVSGLSVDEARLASETLTWLESNGYAEQARDAIVVLNQSTPGVPLVRLNELETHFATRTKRVVRVPYDAQIAGGGAIVFANLQPETRQAARELAAHLVESLRARSA